MFSISTRSPPARRRIGASIVSSLFVSDTRPFCNFQHLLLSISPPCYSYYSRLSNAKMAAVTKKVNAHSYTTLQPEGIAVPRPSASLVLLDAQNRILLTHRTSTIGSFANAHVFPGGNQDPKDASPEFCAIRETFEETGVLLTNPEPPSSLLPQFSQIRRDVHSRTHSLTFNQFLKENGLEADVGGLIPFTTWITPPTMKKRYETHMFLGFLPLSSSSTSSSSSSSQLPTSDGGVETVSTTFMTAEEILTGLKQNSIILFPPQAYLVTRLARFLNDKGLKVEEQRERIKKWIEEEGVGKYVFEPRPEGKTKDGKRLILGYGPRGDVNRKSVLRFGKTGLPADLQIVEATEAAKL
ncbi:hypothetical protein TWF225_011708 [Orbilia oligospora]|nr:hypothetical protein TWF225_011708 [Orbilia oligospora]KAF3244132.1 hypothetical protein TWF128_009832 [Orbilia oligospora]KAF3244669.1 hypothetical protein TWF217_010714 [Orbilia oligospora]KAF3277852.1 hypothetical protein TWF132_001376 [Orbilia oligospora]